MRSSGTYRRASSAYRRRMNSPRRPSRLDRLQTLELPDAVVHVHHVIARLELARNR